MMSMDSERCNLCIPSRRVASVRGNAQNIDVFTIHTGSFLSIPFRINVDDEGYQDLGTAVGYVTFIFVVEYDAGRNILRQFHSWQFDGFCQDLTDARLPTTWDRRGYEAMAVVYKN